MNAIETSVVGQDAVKKLLRQTLNSRQFSHAYLFEGPLGLGKETLAREFAAAILCGEDHPPCHRCKSCQQVAAGTHRELRLVQPEDPEKESSISVDTIREMIKDIYLKPYEGEWKVYLIPRAEHMTFQAQNALLKTLEEPPDHAVIILTSAHSEKLLPTALSRCQRAVFRPASKEAIEKWLLNRYTLTETQAKQLAAFANGTHDRAVKMMESETYRHMRHQFLELTDRLAEGRLSPLLEAGEWLQQEKSQTLEVLALWQEWIRDVQVIHLGGEQELLIFQDQLDRLKQQAPALRQQACTSALKLLEEAREDLLNHGNLPFVTDTLLINLVNSFTPLSSPALRG